MSNDELVTLILILTVPILVWFGLKVAIATWPTVEAILKVM